MNAFLRFLVSHGVLRSRILDWQRERIGMHHRYIPDKVSSLQHVAANHYSYPVGRWGMQLAQAMLHGMSDHCYAEDDALTLEILVSVRQSFYKFIRRSRTDFHESDRAVLLYLDILELEMS